MDMEHLLLVVRDDTWRMAERTGAQGAAQAGKCVGWRKIILPAGLVRQRESFDRLKHIRLMCHSFIESALIKTRCIITTDKFTLL
jgi:hypothetical protein